MGFQCLVCHFEWISSTNQVTTPPPPPAQQPGGKKNIRWWWAGIFFFFFGVSGWKGKGWVRIWQISSKNVLLGTTYMSRDMLPIQYKGNSFTFKVFLIKKRKGISDVVLHQMHFTFQQFFHIHYPTTYSVSLPHLVHIHLGILTLNSENNYLQTSITESNIIND